MRFKWALMVLTQPGRDKFLRRLLDVLDPQTEAYPEVHVDVRMFDRGLSLGENREVMRQDSMGEWVNFIDDDDIVPEDYVATILPRMTDDVDYIGHRIQFYQDGRLGRPIFHSLKYSDWNTVDGQQLRDISHVNPMRRKLALTCSMEGGVAEDFRWAAKMRETGLVKREHYIDRALYFYYFRTNKVEVPVVRESEKDVRLEEINRCEMVLSWIYSVKGYLDRRRLVVEEKSPNLEFRAKDIQLEELGLLEAGFDLHPVRTYIKQRREEIAGL